MIEPAPNNSQKFQTKFNQLKDSLTKRLGNPTYKNIEHNITREDAFRDDLKWNGTNCVKAYLLMFGNRVNNYREIRLIIYND